jgi:hypothetical protein
MAKGRYSFQSKGGFTLKKGAFIRYLLALTSIVQAAIYEIGDGDNVADVPWDVLLPGDLVLIHARTTPYREKWVICCNGTESQPITIRGVPDAQGTLPVIDGINAVTPTALNYWNEARGVIKIGGANRPSGSGSSWIILENLDIKSGRQPYSFTGRNGLTAYAKNAAAIFLENGQNITIRNCILRDSGNGLFAASASGNILVESCYIYDNGVENSFYEHNNYTEAKGITFQFNRFGPLRADCDGNNLKDRSAGCLIRYNWIEGGNRQLDLVDSGYAELIQLPAYRTTKVYGNILIEPDGDGNSQICHYGGDSGDTNRYRQGTLHFYHNTILSTRTGNTTLLRLSSNHETADCRNNIIYTTATGNRLALIDNTGTALLRHNWLPTGWRVSHNNPAADVQDLGGNITGSDPLFIDFNNQNLGLASNSPCIAAAGPLVAESLQLQYVKHRASTNRIVDTAPDLGAFEMLSDSDLDGATDYQEYIAGTDPANPQSLFALSTSRPAPQALHLHWPAAPDRTYILSSSASLSSSWHPILTNQVQVPCTATFTNYSFSSNRFYRVEARLTP